MESLAEEASGLQGNVSCEQSVERNGSLLPPLLSPRFPLPLPGPETKGCCSSISLLYPTPPYTTANHPSIHNSQPIRKPGRESVTKELLGWDQAELKRLNFSPQEPNPTPLYLSGVCMVWTEEEEIWSLARSIRNESSCLSSPLSPHTPPANYLRRTMVGSWVGHSQGVKVPLWRTWKKVSGMG